MESLSCCVRSFLVLLFHLFLCGQWPVHPQALQIPGDVQASWTVDKSGASQPGKMFVSAGDVTIAGIFPMFGSPRCSKFNHKTTAWYVEPFLHVLRKYNFSLTASVEKPNAPGEKFVRRLRVGYSVMDQCWDDVMPSVYATLHLTGIIGSHCTSHGPRSPNRVMAVIGPSKDDRMVQSTAPICSVQRVVQVATRCSLDHFSMHQDNERNSILSGYEYLFRAASSDRYQAYAIADILNYFNWTHFAVIAGTDLTSSSLLSEFNAHAKANRFCIAFTASFDTYEDAVQITQRLRHHPQARVIILIAPYTKVMMLMDAVVKENALRNESLSRIWIGNDKWGRAMDAVLEGEKYKKTVQGLFVTEPRPPEQFLGQGKNGTMSASISKYLRSITAEQLRKAPNLSGNPFLCRVLEQSRNCTGVCHFAEKTQTNKLSGPGLQVCEDSATIPDQLEQPSGQVLSEMVEPFTILATDVVMHALQALFRKTVKKHPQLTGHDLAEKFYKFAHGPRLKARMKKTALPCADKKKCSVFSGRHELLPEYFIMAADKYFTRTMKVGYWKADSLDIGRAKKTIEINAELLHFGKEVFGEEELYSTKDQTAQSLLPSSKCDDYCPPGSAIVHLQSQQAACCHVCEECPNNEISPGGRNPCTVCPEGSAASMNKTVCTELPVSFGDWTWMLVILSSVGAGATLVVAIILVLFRESPIVRASDRCLTAILLISMLVGYSSIYPVLMRPTSFICLLRRLSSIIALLSSTIIVLVKSGRLVQVHFQSRTFRRINRSWSLSTPAQLLFVLVLLLLGVVLELAVMARQPPRPKRHHTPTVTYLLCVTPPYQALVIDAYLAVMITVITAFAWVTRKLPKHYNEARLLFMVSLSQCAIWGVLRPLYYLSSAPTKHTFAATLVILHVTTILLWVFVPRVWQLAFRKPPKRHSALFDLRRFSTGPVSSSSFTLPSPWSKVTYSFDIKNWPSLVLRILTFRFLPLWQLFTKKMLALFSRRHGWYENVQKIEVMAPDSAYRLFWLITAFGWWRWSLVGVW